MLTAAVSRIIEALTIAFSSVGTVMGLAFIRWLATVVAF
jgi:hypothetical protein